MDTRSTHETSRPLTWPLAGSLLLTAFTVALVCERPAAALHSWGRVFWLATLYLVVAGAVHAIAVWGVCRVREESETAGWRLIWQAIWIAWIAIVWLPLISLLTSERSPWVAAVLPVTAIFAMLVLRDRPGRADVELAFESLQPAQPPGLFYVEDTTATGRALFPAILTAVAIQIGVAMLAARHDWTAGMLLGAATIYPLERWLDRAGPVREEGRRAGRKTSAGNSLVVWMLLVLALAPLLTIYATSILARVMAIGVPALPRIATRPLAHPRSTDNSGVILYLPHKPHVIAVPQPEIATNALSKPTDIPFDGVYWYFKQPDTRPRPNARITQGDPIKRRVWSTDEEPLIMEAHQPLGRPISLSCCRSLRVNVTNANNVPGSIGLEVLLRNTASKKGTRISLGTLVLATSTVSPMPLKRPPVEDSVTFPLPRSLSQTLHEKSFNEITVRIKPEKSMAQAGPQVAIKSFALQP
jgi:hypothetical protein